MKNSRAFTLIELLVVVAIIALLISILLPSLSSARKVAQQVGCLAHLRGVGQAMNLYGMDSRQFLAGPNTSGAHITNGFSSWVNSPTEPTYNADWISPTLGDMLGLPDDRNERIEAIFNNKLRCPANREEYDYEYPSTNPVEGLAVNSYSSPIGFHQTDSSKPTANDGAITNKIPKAPSNYIPRLDAVGPPASKVYAMDGVRYVDYSTGKISYNPLTWQDEGGNFLTLSPAFPNAKPDGNPYKRNLTGALTDEAIQFAYRHVNTSLNVVFFDGHCENLEEETSRDAAYYFPCGSRMRLLSGLPFGYTSSYTLGSYIP